MGAPRVPLARWEPPRVPQPGGGPRVPPSPARQGTPRVHPPGQDNRRSAGYAVGSMPLAFTQEDFLDLFDLFGNRDVSDI